MNYIEYDDTGSIADAGKASSGYADEEAYASYEARAVEWVMVAVDCLDDIPERNAQYDFYSSKFGSGLIQGLISRIEYLGDGVFKIFLDGGRIFEMGFKPIQSPCGW